MVTFEFFAETKLKCKVKKVNAAESGRYLLLCNINSRIPNDVKSTFTDLGIIGMKTKIHKV